MQMTTRVNEAYRTLRDPLARAVHLLELQGVDPGFEDNTAMPAAFLAEQMELRERLDWLVANGKLLRENLFDGIWVQPAAGDAGGAVGAALRYQLGRLAGHLTPGATWPWGTFAANLIGGFAMGLLAGWLAREGGAAAK